MEDEVCVRYFADNDKDGFGGEARADCTEIQPTDTLNSSDCDDEDHLTYPGAAINEDDSACMRDADGDGYGDMAVRNGVTPGTDCNDDPDAGGEEQYPGRPYYPDCDGDGYYAWTDEEQVRRACIPPEADALCDKVLPDRSDPIDTIHILDSADGDCDDNDSDINPEAIEICDDFDNNCDGLIDDKDPSLDESTGTAYYDDTDGDLSGDPATEVWQCDQPAGTVENNWDCDDTELALHKDTVWYKDSDGDGHGSQYDSIQQCEDPSPSSGSSYVLDGDDCDDDNDSTYPGATEECDGEDNNCDSVIPDDETDDDGDGYSECEDDCDDSDGTEYPNQDWYPDCDGDGAFNRHGGLSQCERPSSQDACGSSDPVDFTNDKPSNPEKDCDDEDEDEHPGVIWYEDYDGDTYGNPDVYNECFRYEPTDVLDDTDCNDDDPDENPGVIWYADYDGDTYGDPDTYNECSRKLTTDVLDDTDCDDSNLAIYPGAAEEVGDDVDDDCNGKVTCFKDFDKDGDGNPDLAEVKEISEDHCDFPSKRASDNDLDCNDNNENQNSSTTWAVDGDGDTYGDPEAIAELQCDAPSGIGIDYVIFDASEADCDDTDPEIYPYATEIAGDAIDQDCDDSFTCFSDADLDGYGDASTVEMPFGCFEWGASEYDDSDCNDSNASIFLGAFEIPGDGIDQDCDGNENCYEDHDGDGYGGTEEEIDISSFTTCADAGYVENFGDCNRQDATKNPAMGPASNGDCCECSITGEWQPVDVTDYVQFGSTDSLFASSMAALGDINGDGFNDFIVGAPNTTVTQGWVEPSDYVDVGKVFIYTSLASGTAIAGNGAAFNIQGKGEFEYFGFEVASLGDWNDDDLDDFIVSSAGEVVASSGGVPGAVFAFAGARDAADLPTERADNMFLITQFKDSRYFGEDLLAAPLFDKDHKDLVIYDSDVGYVYIVPKQNLADESTIATASTTSIELESRSNSGNLGELKSNNLASIPTSNGIHRLAVGNPFANSEGEVLIFKVPETGSLDPTDALTTLSFPGFDSKGETAHFGMVVLSADINGDFYPDLVASAPGEDGPGGNTSDVGAVYIYYYDLTIGGYSTAPDITIYGVEDEQLGVAVTTIDINGDQRLELVIGAPATESTYIIPSQALSAGSHEVLQVPNVIRLYSDSSTASFGMTVANGGDLISDGNNLPELIVGAPLMTTDIGTGAKDQGLFVAIPGSKLPLIDYTP